MSVPWNAPLVYGLRSAESLSNVARASCPHQILAFQSSLQRLAQEPPPTPDSTQRLQKSLLLPANLRHGWSIRPRRENHPTMREISPTVLEKQSDPREVRPPRPLTRPTAPEIPPTAPEPASTAWENVSTTRDFPPTARENHFPASLAPFSIPSPL